MCSAITAKEVTALEMPEIILGIVRIKNRLRNKVQYSKLLICRLGVL